MLTFLRKIRRSLIDSGSMRKYMLYATGEIALVVMGILIALQINNWNEWRKDRKIENEILTDIKKNIELNIRFIGTNQSFNERGSASYKIILQSIESKRHWVDSLGKHIAPALVVRPPTISFSAYDALKNRGVELIRSDHLRGSVIDLFESNYNNLLTVENRIINIELKPTIAEFTMSNMEWKEINNKKHLAPNNPDAILKNQHFKNILSNIENYREMIFFNGEGWAIEQSEKVLQLIKEELSRPK